MTVEPESKADVSTDVAERKSDPEKNQEKDRCGIANTFPSCVPLCPPLLSHLFPTCSTCLPLVSLLRPSCLLLVSHFFSACRPLFSTCLPLVPHLFPTAGSCWVSIFIHCVAVPPLLACAGFREPRNFVSHCVSHCVFPIFFSFVTHQEHWNLVCYCVFHLSPNLFATVFRIVSPTLSVS